MERIHQYCVAVNWTGDTGVGTLRADRYERSHTISVSGKPDLLGSSDTVFRGDATKYNPEDLLVASLSVCHMLWYLHLCADAGVVVRSYVDRAEGVMVEIPGGGGHFTQVKLRPVIGLEDISKSDLAASLHHAAHKKCFIANSVNFPVTQEPSFFKAD